jgi:anti-sigma factor RsiW
MCEQKNGLLNPYLDGELRGTRRDELERHLETCPSCRAELHELRRVSDLLRLAPSPAFTPPERFAANLVLRLNAQNEALPQPDFTRADKPRRGPSLAWWLAPAGLFAAWIFLQAVLTVSGALGLAEGSGLLGQAAAWLPAGASHSLWFSAALDLFGAQLSQAGQPALALFGQLDSLAASILGQFLWQALVALLYWIWLAAWWLKGRPQLIEMRHA